MWFMNFYEQVGDREIFFDVFLRIMEYLFSFMYKEFVKNWIIMM